MRRTDRNKCSENIIVKKSHRSQGSKTSLRKYIKKYIAKNTPFEKHKKLAAETTKYKILENTYSILILII